MAGQSIPVNEEWLVQARAIIANAPAATDFLDKCKACGLNTESREEELRRQVEFASNFLRNFAPDENG